MILSKTFLLLFILLLLQLHASDAFWFTEILSFFCSIPFLGSLFPFCNNDSNTITTTIRGGGIVQLSNVITINFPQQTFLDDNTDETSVVIEKIQNNVILEDSIREDIAIFLPDERLAYQIRINLSNQPITSSNIQIDVSIPSNFITSLGDNGKQIEIFAAIEQRSTIENPFILFDLLQSCSSSFLSQQGLISCILPSYAFTRQQQNYIATIAIASTRPVVRRQLRNTYLIRDNERRITREKEDRNLQSTTNCEGEPLQCPLPIGCNTLSPFRRVIDDGNNNEDRVTHLAVDYEAPQETPVLAAADGIVIFVEDTTNLGGTIVIRHEFGATRYCYLSVFNVGIGVEVTVGDRIGLSGGTPGTSMSGLSSIGPHLHIEYSPNDESGNALSRIDPEVCISSPINPEPSISPTTNAPTKTPTNSQITPIPTSIPTNAPTKTPTNSPLTRIPTSTPTSIPATLPPSPAPTFAPSPFISNLSLLWPGTYSGEVQFLVNGEGNFGNGGIYPMVVSEDGQITINGTVLDDFDFDEETNRLTWRITNQVTTEGNIDFRVNSTDPYFFKDQPGNNVPGRCFVGRIKVPGRTIFWDYRGIESSVRDEPTAAPITGPTQQPTPVPTPAPTIRESLTLLETFTLPSRPIALGVDFSQINSDATFWTYDEFGINITHYDGSGTKLIEFPANVSTDAADIDIYEGRININGTILVSGYTKVLFLDDLNSSSGVARISAFFANTGSLLAQVNVQDLNSNENCVGIAYHPTRGTTFLVAWGPDSVIEVDQETGVVLNRFDLPSNYDVFYGDISVNAATGNLFVMSSATESILELTPDGDVIRYWSWPTEFLTADVGNLAGMAVACGEIWLASDLGQIYRTGTLDNDIEPDCFTSRLNELESISIPVSPIALGVDRSSEGTSFWIFNETGTTSIEQYGTSGTILSSFSYGSTTNEGDIEIIDDAISINGTDLAEGTKKVLFLDGRLGAQIFAFSTTGTLLAQVQAQGISSFEDTAGLTYHPIRQTFFVVSWVLDSVIEINPDNGSIRSRFNLPKLFDVSYGDISVNRATGNLFILSSVETKIAEMMPTGAFVRYHVLPEGLYFPEYGQLAGMTVACQEVWLASRTGTIYRTGSLDNEIESGC